MKKRSIIVATSLALALVVQAQAGTGKAVRGELPKAAQGTKGQYAEVNGHKFYYEVHGTGKPLVLLHGAFGTVEGWAGLLPTLAKSRRVVTIEMQGHGRTPDRDKALSYDQMVEDAAAVLRYLKIQDADVFGYSMGGALGLGLAVRHPDLVGKLAILGSNAGAMSAAYDPEVYKQFQSLPDDFAPSVLKDPYDRVAPDKSKWPVLVKKIKALGNEFKGFSNEEIKSIKASVLIMQGDRDGVRPEHAVEMFRLIPKSQLAIFPGGDHFVLYTSPDKVLAALTAFLDAPTTVTKSGS